MPYRSKCAKCDFSAVQTWSIFGGETAIVVPLCSEHGAYLNELVELVGPKPDPPTASVPKVSVRALKARPLDWTPPA